MRDSILLFFLLIIQIIKFFLIPFAGVDYWIIDNFHHAPYSFYPSYWNGKFLNSPYSFIWQILYLPTSVIGWLPWLWFMWCFDTLLLLIVWKYRSSLYLLLFSISSFTLFLLSPEDLWMFFFAVLGRESKWMSLLSALTKLPFLAPLYVWNFVFTVSVVGQSDIFANPEGIPRYLCLGLWILHPWLIKLCVLLKTLRK